MKTRIFFLSLFLFWSVACQSIETSIFSQENRLKSNTSYTLQYEKEISKKVLKVGPNLEISIGQFALESFDSLGSQFFHVRSYEERNLNAPLEPGSIVLTQVQVNRNLVFEEGTTKFQYATFASIVELVFVQNSGETFRILGQSKPMQLYQIPFGPEDRESEKTIAKSIRQAVEVGFKKIHLSKETTNSKSNHIMFQRPM